jgi:multiple sugar transport system substrate-binding protein
MSEPRAKFLGRRSFLKWSTLTLGLAAAAPVLQACGGAAPTATSAPKPVEPAKPSAPAAAAPTNTPAAAAKPAEATKPAAAAAATNTPAAAAKPAEPTKPAAAAEPTKPAAAAAGAPTATPAPSQTVVQAVSALEKPKSSKTVNGKLQVLQNQDFHPDHNAFVRLLLEEWGKAQSWPMDISYIAGFQGGSDLNQKLTAMVQAGTPPDIMDHNVSHHQQVFLGVLEDITPFVTEMESQHGKTVTGIRMGAQIDGKWYGAPYYTRHGGYYMRTDWFKEAGIDVDKGTETYDIMRETALKISDPDKKRWGWGMTVNRSGDGESIVQNLIHANGGRTQDKAGQLVTLNSPETIKGFDWLKETYTDPKWAKALPPGVNAWNDISNNEAFLAGTLGITQNAGTMLAKSYFDKVPHAEAIGYVQTPKSLNGQGPRLESGGGETLRLVKGTKNKDAAFDTMRFWLSTPVQQQIWKISTSYALPAYANGWKDPIIASRPISAKFEAVVNNEDWWGIATPGPIQAAVDAVAASNMFTDTMGEILKGKPTAQAVKEMHDRAVKIFKEFGLKGA